MLKLNAGFYDVLLGFSTYIRISPHNPAISYNIVPNINTTLSRTPNALKSNSREQVKMEISGPEAPRYLVDDTELNERT